MTHPKNNAPASSINLEQTFRGRRFVVLGGTGFLGKVWVSMLLHRFPDVGQLYLLVRSKKELSSEQRFLTEILESESFEPLREQHGDGWRRFMKDKITPIDGDVSKSMVGIDEDTIAKLKGKVDAVVNVAGVVDFNPPIDEAIRVNCFGVQHIMELCKALGNAPLMHTSTCYVAGNRDGTILEEDPRDRPFPRCGEIDIKHWDPEREILEGARLTERAHHDANEAFRQSEFAEQAKENLRRKGESCRGEVLDNEIKKIHDKFVDDMLMREGQARAEHWGWTNTYTYTKSIGEQLLLSSELDVTIVRPAIIESSMSFPCVGWNEGINTSAPLIYIILRGNTPHLPGSWDCDLDLIPCDYVCSGMLASLGALLLKRHKTVYQYGTSSTNPASTARLQEIISLYKRRDRRKNPRGNPLFNALQKSYGSVPVSSDYFRKYAEPAYARAASGLSSWAKKASAVPGLGFLKGASKGLSGISRQLNNTAKVYETFMPFMHDRRYRFDTSHTQELMAQLDEDSRARLPYAPDTMDWRYYFTEVHIPGLEKWVMPLIDDKLRKEKKQLRRFPDLIAMMEERVEENYYGIAMQKLVDERLRRMTYGEFRRGVYSIAARLQEAGVKKGDSVILAGNNSPYWGMSYFGILKAGGVAVPIDPDLDLARLRNLVRSSHAKHAIWDQDFEVACGAAYLETVNNGVKALERLLIEELEQLEEKTPEAVEIDPKDVASLIFTSGTTGEPKGVMLTHDNFTSILASLVPLFPLDHTDCSLSLLPLHHTFEFSCGLLLPFSRGARITYIEELTGENVLTAMQKARVTALVGVPALWQLLGRRIETKVRDRGKLAQSLFNSLLKANQSIGRNLGFDLGKVLFAPVHSQFGGHLRYLISGGAALPKETQKLFSGLGLHLTEGYGLTEAAPVLTVSKSSPRAKFGSVGTSIPGVEIKIDSPNEQGIGEILARGDNVMLGYYGNEDATGQVISEGGWLHTGDLGKIDHKGRLSIVGRAKEVIVTTNGENVYPDDLEELIGLPKGIEELTIVGIPDPKGDEQVALLAVPTKTEHSNGVDYGARVAAAREQLKKKIKDVPRALRPTVIYFQDEKLPRTATRKVKRKEVQAIIERLEQQSRQELPAVTTPLSTKIVQTLSRITGATEKQVKNSARLAADLGIDSLTMNELHVEIEGVVGHSLPAEELASCETVSEIQALVEKVVHRGPTARNEQQPKAKKRDDNDVPILPRAVQEATKDLMRTVQLAFYDKVMDVKVYGQANIPHNRNTIVVSNHASHLDLGLIKSALGSYAQDIVTLGAKDYFFEGDKVRKFYFENFTNVIAIERKLGTEEGLKGAHDAVREGKTLLIFPEGTRGTTGTISKFRAGVGYLALEHEIDILPVYIEGTYDAMPKGRPLPTSRKLSVHIGAVLPFEQLLAKVEQLPKQKAVRAIAQISQSAVEHLKARQVFDLPGYTLEEPRPQLTVEEKLEQLFRYLHERFDAAQVQKPISFYFSLGNEHAAKWSLVIGADSCKAHRGKPEGGVADCVLKTSPEIFQKIVKEAYVPSPDQFISGAIKSNNIPLLQDFVRIFHLQ